MKFTCCYTAIYSSLLFIALGLPSASAHDQTHSATAASAFGQPGVAKAVKRSIDIHMTDAMRFNPASLIIKQGETLRMRIHNDGKLEHEFVLGTHEEIEEHAEMMRQMPNMIHTDASSIRVAAGKSAEIVWKFSRAGKFYYACLIPGHREAGMQGVVTVTAPVKK